jgi:Ca2+-binding EF-hand superfamily protein
MGFWKEVALSIAFGVLQAITQVDARDIHDEEDVEDQEESDEEPTDSQDEEDDQDPDEEDPEDEEDEEDTDPEASEDEKDSQSSRSDQDDREDRQTAVHLHMHMPGPARAHSLVEKHAKKAVAHLLSSEAVGKGMRKSRDSVNSKSSRASRSSQPQPPHAASPSTLVPKSSPASKLSQRQPLHAAPPAAAAASGPKTQLAGRVKQTLASSKAFATSPKDVRPSLKRLCEAFCTIDTDGKNKINQKQLQRLLELLGEHRTPEDVASMSEGYDENSDGFIDFDELVELMNLEVFHDMFNDIDKNGDGTLTRREFMTGMRKKGFSGSLEAIFDQVDDDGDGVVSYVEFARLVNSITQRRP